MKIFRCDHCGHPVFFENVQCLNCGSALAFLPDVLAVCAIESDGGGDATLWKRKNARAWRISGTRYRLCRNNAVHQACNFAVLDSDPDALCVSCRQTRVLPDLSQPANHERWRNIEVAKRRLFYTLARLGLVAPDTYEGPVFEFLADLPGGPSILTGHMDGVITLNVAEADDDERVRRRLALHEPYRTLLGHLRHESGHYYWDRLVRDIDRIAAFREVFGDESVDYRQALQDHYARSGNHGPWQQGHVSAYATAHPWEDWAETWAHYLHMVDLLETAASYHTKVVVPGEPDSPEVSNPFGALDNFDHLVSEWVPVTLLLNSLNRSLGQDDAYPFALTQGALRKLRFVHDVIHGSVREPVTEMDPPLDEPANESSAQTDGQPDDASETAPA
jgi:hypothetical protein